MDWAMKTKGYNQRRACALAGIDPRVYRRMSKRPTDAALRARMKELGSERRRFGYRHLHILLKREGWEVYRKNLYRLYREEGLTVRKRGGRKRAVGTSTPMATPQGPNQKWSRLYARRAGGRSPLPRVERDRRLQPGVPCRSGRYIHRWRTCRSRTGSHRLIARVSLPCGQR